MGRRLGRVARCSLLVVTWVLAGRLGYFGVSRIELVGHTRVREGWGTAVRLATSPAQAARFASPPDGRWVRRRTRSITRLIERWNGLELVSDAIAS